MATNSELAHKLLHDLRLRKQHLTHAASDAQNPADASGNPGYTTERSGNMNTPERDTNGIVPPRSGHQLRKTKGFSMAITYAFDDGGPLKSAGFPSKGTLMGFFQKSKDRSMQQSPNQQLQSTNELPTITNLEINDIAKESQKLRQILKVRSFSLDFDKGSKEIGNELWRGAMELEQSLKLLANLQESSKKSSLKRADGDGNEDDNPIIMAKQTQVERPVFSFDKASKNRKGSTEDEMVPKLLDSTNVNGPSNFRPENQVSVTTKSTSKLSTSRDLECQSSQRTNSSKLKHTGKIPNVIAKLMGLEELRKEINKKIATENQITSKPRLGVVVSSNEAYRSLLSSEEKTKYVKNAETRIQNVVKSNKITIMKPHGPEVPKENCRATYNHQSTTNPVEPKWNERDREAVKDDLVVSKEAIFKINELRSQITEIKHYKTRPKDSRNEIGDARRKVQAMDDVKRLQPMEVKRQKSEAVDEHQVQELKHCGTHERRKRAMTKPILQQKQKKEIQLQQPKVLSGKGTCGLKSKVRSQQKIGNKTEPEIPEGRSMLKKSSNVKADVHKLLKKTPMTQSNTTKENTTKGKGLTTSEASKGDERNEVRAGNGNCINSDGKEKCLVNVKPEQNSTSTEVLNANLARESGTKVLNGTKSQIKQSQLTKNGTMSQNQKTTNKTARAVNTHRPRMQKGTQRSSISEASPGKGILSKPTQKIPGNTKPSTQASQQQADVEQISTQNNGIEDESHHKEIVHGLPTNEKNLSTTISSVFDHLTVPDEVQEVKSQRTATDGCNDRKNILYDVQEIQATTQIEKQNQLTEDEMHLKQMLMMSNILLNTAEAFFKLKIPISVLSHANNQNCQEKNSKLILDCSYEVMRRKGRNEELLLYPHITMNTNHRMITSLDDLVRELHKEFEILKCYGRNQSDEYEYTYLLKMIEKDMHYKDPDLNCMWEFSWKDTLFACMEIDEVISDVEKEVLEQLFDEITNDFMLSL